MLDTGRHELILSELHEWPENPRSIDESMLEHLKQSLKDGEDLLQARPLIALPDGTVIAGNMRLRALRELGRDLAPVYVIDVDTQRAREIALMDNNQFGVWRTDELAVMLEDLMAEGTDPLALGFASSEVDEMMAALHKPEKDPDDAPPLPPEPTTVFGEVIRLGDHTLVCGDATDERAITAAADGQAARCMWTDPPYGVDYVGKTADALTIDGDQATSLPALLEGAFEAADVVLAAGAAIYVAHPAGPLSLVFGQEFVDRGWRYHETLIWDKQTMVLGHADYHYRHEPIIYGYKRGDGRRGRGGEGWYGDNKQVSVLEFPKPSRSSEHPTMKPVEMIEACLRNSTERGATVLDPFGGSGSTLIACERLGRRCAMVELDPAYCDVIVTRWEDLTDQKAER